MARTPNYNMQRSDRNRAKQAKKDEKLREREEAVARRKAERETAASAPTAQPGQPMNANPGETPGES
jgi:hypothetical protein